MEFEDRVRLLREFESLEKDQEGIVVQKSRWGEVLVSFDGTSVWVPQGYLGYPKGETSPPVPKNRPEEYIHFYGPEEVELRLPVAVERGPGVGLILGPGSMVVLDVRGAFPRESDERVKVWTGPGYSFVEFKDLHIPEDVRDHVRTFRKWEEVYTVNRVRCLGVVLEPGSKVLVAEEAKYRPVRTVKILFPGFIQEVPVRCLHRLKFSTNPNEGVSVYTWRG